MRSPSPTPWSAPYVLCDKRADGRVRELGRFISPAEALAAQELLREAGARTVEVQVAPATDPLARDDE